jgi:hypothetical protein
MPCCPAVAASSRLGLGKSELAMTEILHFHDASVVCRTSIA